MATVSSKLSLCIAAVALALCNLCLSLGSFVSGKRSANVNGFSKGAIRLVAHIAFIACMRFNEFPFAGGFGRHVAPFEMYSISKSQLEGA